MGSAHISNTKQRKAKWFFEITIFGERKLNHKTNKPKHTKKKPIFQIQKILEIEKEKERE